MRFHGEYIYHVDPQGRISIPARFRDAFKGGIFLTKGLDPCIWAFTTDGWDSWSGAIAALSPNKRQARILRRMTFGSAFDLELDRQGRVMLPPPLRNYANLRDEVVLVGGGDYLELWDRQHWEEQELPFVEEAASRMADSAEEANR